LDLKVTSDGVPAIAQYFDQSFGANPVPEMMTLFSATGSEAINDGGWHHLVATWNQDTLKLYVDGVLAEATPVTGVAFYAWGKQVNIGRQCDHCTADWPGFLGDIAHVA